MIATLARDVHGFENFDQVQSIHNAFKTFAGRIGELFQLRQQEDRILGEIGIRSERRAIFGQPVEIEISEKDVPLWIDEVKFQRLRELETQRDTIQQEINDLSGYLPLLYGTGEPLEEAVVKALQFLGLNAERAPEGFTADILAQTTDGVRKFGFEVTGTTGAIKKDSKKLAQLLEFERIKEHGEKTVLVANTYNMMSISQRKEQGHFTSRVLEFLSRHPILLMTGWDLYCMVGDVLEGLRSKEEIIEILYTTNGQLKYERSA